MKEGTKRKPCALLLPLCLNLAHLLLPILVGLALGLLLNDR